MVDELAVEVIMTFKLDKFNNNDYMIYKVNNEYFAAKYIEKDDKIYLETYLSDDEKKVLSDIYDKLSNGGII